MKIRTSAGQVIDRRHRSWLRGGDRIGAVAEHRRAIASRCAPQSVGRHAALAATFVVLTACKGTRAYERKTGPAYEGETTSWVAAVKTLGANGMWIVSRGYHPGDDFIATASNAEFSHASVLDLGAGELIEAVGGGVKTRPLSDFLRETHRFMLIRPTGWSAVDGANAVAKARSMIGHGYDFSGVLGAPTPERFYCSELAVWAWGLPTDRFGAQHVLHPKDVVRYGTVLFESGERDGTPDFPRANRSK